MCDERSACRGLCPQEELAQQLRVVAVVAAALPLPNAMRPAPTKADAVLPPSCVALVASTADAVLGTCPSDDSLIWVARRVFGFTFVPVTAWFAIFF
jgi:hypothetical protein